MENKENAKVSETPTVKEPAFLTQYRAVYPTSKKFHVTSDNLVFLEREYKQALAHQRTIGKGELSTY